MFEVNEENSSESSGNEKPKNKFEISTALREKLKEYPEVLDYIKLLHKYIKKQKRRLKKTKSKLKKSLKTREIGTQTDSVENNIIASKNLIDEIKEAAELATHNSGFVYDEGSGLYYDSSTGYYYNAEYCLYYDATTGTYMSYNQETNSYDFHSQVAQRDIQLTKNFTKRKKKSKDEIKAPKYLRLTKDSLPTPEVEEGECSQSDSDLSDETNSVYSELSQQWPPCMRIIVEQSQSPKIKIGSLHIITFDGGTLGREGNHAILIQDINISKCHLKFTFDQTNNQYLVVDMGSRNGTILNGKRMAPAKQESEACHVAHGSRIQIGSTVLLCHIHEGNGTCGHCEPGLIQKSEVKFEEKLLMLSKSEKHKSELKSLRKKFGVSYYEEQNTKLASGYTDRAQKRRDTIGSQNPHEKTEVASLNESIRAENKGFKMLAKMGWKEGQSLGKDSQGMLEPINLISNPGTSGMGNNESNIPENISLDKEKQIVWKKTQERFKKLSSTNVIFDDSD